MHLHGTPGNIGGFGMDFGGIFVILGISILSSLSCKNSTVEMIKRYGTIARLKGYVSPARWVRRLFKLKKCLIPRYLYFELILSLLFALLGPMNLIIGLFVGGDPDIMGILVMFHICLIIINMVFFSVMSFRLKK